MQAKAPGRANVGLGYRPARRHRAIEFKKFLARIDKAVPAALDVHLICDNYVTRNTAEIQTWLARHPFHVHFTRPAPRG